MKCEIPEYARCCFCFPLRYGLLVWAYTKLVFIGLILFNNIGEIVISISLERISKVNLPLFVLLFLITIFFCVDFVFHIIFIISAHKKSTTKMRLFYMETLFGLIFYVFCFIYFLVFFLTKFYVIELFMEVEIWCLFLFVIIAQGYLIILVRSEVLKLERKSNLQFTNLTSTAEEQSNTIDTNIVA